MIARIINVLRDYGPVISLMSLIITSLILIGSALFVWPPPTKSPQLEAEWSSSYGVKVDENHLNLVNQSQSRSINITLEVYNTGNATAHGVGVSFDYTMGIGHSDYLLIYENDQYRATTYSNVYQLGLLQEGSCFTVVVLFRVSFHSIWNSSLNPELYLRVFSTEFPTEDIEIELNLV